MGAPWVPAFGKDVGPGLELARLRPGEVFMDLGCGDGRFVLAAARIGAKSFGYEINPLMYLVARLRVARKSNAHIRLGNMWAQDFSRADVIAAFMTPKYMARLEAKLVHEAKPGTRVLIYVFKLPTLQPKKFAHNTYLYEF